MATSNMSPRFDSAPDFRGFKFYNHANEIQHGGKIEPKHVHVDTPMGKAKFWLDHPDTLGVELAENKGIPKPVINDIKRHIERHKDLFIKDWDDSVAKNNL